MGLFLKNSTDFFGLDIGSTAMRLVELRGSTNQKMLIKYAYVPLANNLSVSDSKADQQKLAQAVLQVYKQSGISTKNVAVGIPSSRVFTTVADVERLSPSELAKAIPYQADSLIPTPLAESKMDWALIGDSPADQTKKKSLLPVFLISLLKVDLICWNQLGLM
ncbi:MAG: hypothetical protein NVS1B10_07200 [Candidatus Saccharimonadales bacterium]